MGFGIKAEVWGEYALFTRPEMKVERVTYDVMTPSAARGLISSIYWHPGMKWIIDRIYVLNPIELATIRRNEVKSKISASNVREVMNGGTGALAIHAQSDIQQRASLILRNVHYIIEAHFDMTDTAASSDSPEKFYSITTRRLKEGQCYYQPCFGCREFPAKFRLFPGGRIMTAYPDTDRDLGFMLYDMDYTDSENITPMFFHAVLRHGVLDLTDCEVYR